MSDYYIRTSEQGESRGPFNASKLNTLAEAGQVSSETLYYDEGKEAWVPLKQNEALLAQVFPQREKLGLEVQQVEKPSKSKRAKNKDADDGIGVDAMLAAAEGDTVERRKLTQRRKSLEKAAEIAPLGLAFMMLLSAVYMVLPLVPLLANQMEVKGLLIALNYPVILVGLFDLLMAVLLLLAVTEIYPLLRGRAMLGLGFNAYLGWAIGDPLFIGLAVAAGAGIFMATITKRVGTLVAAFILGIGSHGYLAYLALNGRFDGFFERVALDLVG